MNQIVRRIDKDGRIARSEGYTRRDRDGPVNGGRDTGPREPDFADWAQDGGNADDRHCGLGGWFVGTGFGLVAVDHAADEGFGADDDEAADSDSDECQAGEAEGPASGALEDYGEGYETEVEEAWTTVSRSRVRGCGGGMIALTVDDSDVYVPEDADWLFDCHNEWPA